MIGATSKVQVMKSLGCAVMLALNDYDPETEHDQLINILSVEGRLIVDYRGQQMQLTYGPRGTFVCPGVSVEFGAGADSRGNNLAPAWVSLYRYVEDGSHEREQENLAFLAGKIRPMITDASRKSCPVYSFDADQASIVAKVGRMNWNDESLRTRPPREDSLIDLDNAKPWVKHFFHFTVFYRID